MSSSTTLKPCPFCGGKASIRRLPTVSGKGRLCCGYFVMCDSCFTTSDNYKSEESAAEHWNRRIPDEA